MLNIVFLLLVAFVGIYLNVWFMMMVLNNRKKIHQTRAPTRFPTISILIPAYNEAKNLSKTLRSILGIDYPKSKLETIVIDNGSTDGTFNIAKRFSKYKIKALRLAERGKSNALNLGLKHAKGELIGMLDADTIVTKDSIKNMVGYFDDKHVGAVTNHVKVASPRGILPSMQDIEYVFSAFSKKLISLLDALYIVPGTLSLARKDLIKSIGFSDDTVTEDMDIAICLLKKDYKIVNTLDAVSYTEVPTSLKGLFRQRIRWYRGFMQNLRKHSDMLFNKKYPHLGYFIFPFSSFLAISVGAVLTLILIFSLIRNGVIFLRDITYMPFLEKVAMTFETISLSSFILEPYSAITYVTILLGSLIVLIVSFRALNVKFRKKFIIIPIYFFIYYSLVMIFWIVSALMELVGWKKKW